MTGLWSLESRDRRSVSVQHSPIGIFSPQIDSYGRVVFVRWDHLQRDQQADSDGPSDRSTRRTRTARSTTPTSRPARQARDADRGLPRAALGARRTSSPGRTSTGHSLNHFFPWMINEDGTEEETLIHLGRHELHGYFNRSLNDDPNLVDFIAGDVGAAPTPTASRTSSRSRKTPRRRARTTGSTHRSSARTPPARSCGSTAGRRHTLSSTIVTYVTPSRATCRRARTQPPDHSGLYRNPLPLSDGTVIAATRPRPTSTPTTGTRANPVSRYAFRLQALDPVERRVRRAARR